LEFERANRIYAAVASGEMDLGVVAYPEPLRNLEIIPFVTDQLVVAMPPDHPLAGREMVEPKELEDYPFIAFAPDIPTRRHIDKLLQSSRVTVKIRQEFDNIETIKRAVEIGAGLSILPMQTIEAEVSHGDMAQARIGKSAKWVRPLGIIRRRGKPPSPAEAKFLAMFKKK
jgi:DNA-binding transcriptional LysR family regulator